MSAVKRVDFLPPEIISCTTCKALVDKSNAAKVRGFMRDELYCLACKPPYDRAFCDKGVWRFYKNVPSHLVEVDENGILVIQPTKDV